MALVLSHPFESLVQFQQELDALRSSDWLGSGPSSRGSYPPVNVFRKGDDLVLIAELPGVVRDQVQVQIKGSTLRISGAKTTEYGENVGMHRRERLAGTFDRAITLPVEVEADQVKAEIRNGILALYLPRAERDKPKTISIG